MEILKGAAIVGQSGGPTAAINATLAGVIKGAFTARSDYGEITRLYGMKNGIDGFMNDTYIDLTERFTAPDGGVDSDKLEILKATPAAALGSCRKKLPDPAKDKEFYETLIKKFKALNIRYFFYIGGNDSMDTVAKLSAYISESDYDMRVVGVPKTIDNDLCGTDHTPGYGSAAKYIAVTMQEIVRDCAVYTIPAVTIVEIMGRDAGWLTAAASISAYLTGAGPDYIYLPESVFSMDAFLADVRAALDKHPNVVIAVSEGVRFADGTYVGESAQSGATDVFGHKYLSGTGKALEMAVKSNIGCKVRSVELNISQRCASHISSLTDINESFSVGYNGVLAAISGKTGVMMSIQRSAMNSYSVSYEPIQVSEIANKVKCVPAEYINELGNNVTDSCAQYILPLIQGEPAQVYRDGLPVHLIIE